MPAKRLFNSATVLCQAGLVSCVQFHVRACQASRSQDDYAMAFSCCSRLSTSARSPRIDTRAGPCLSCRAGLVTASATVTSVAVTGALRNLYVLRRLRLSFSTFASCKHLVHPPLPRLSLGISRLPSGFRGPLVMRLSRAGLAGLSWAACRLYTRTLTRPLPGKM